MNDITVQQLKERMDAGTTPRVIDVREVHEWEADHITEENVPMGTVPVKLPEMGLKNEDEIVVVCRSGGRSGQITNYLRGQGYSNTRNLIGGMLAWKEKIDPGFNVQ